jgi:hypothetical protein
VTDLDTRTIVSAVALAGLLAARGPRGDRIDCSDASLLAWLSVSLGDALLARLAQDKPRIARVFDEGGVELCADGQTIPF